MNTKTMGTAALALATAAGLASGAFADEELAYKKQYDSLYVDGTAYFVTDYVPNHRRTMIEFSAKPGATLDGVALMCANKIVSEGGTDYGTIYRGHFDNDLTFENVSEDVQVCHVGDVPESGQDFVIRYFRNFVEVSFDNGATFKRHYSEYGEETYPDAPAGGKMMLFGSMTPKIGERFMGEVYSVKAWEISPDNTETNLVMDLIPVLSKDNVKTLYDTVSKACLTPTNASHLTVKPLENPNGFVWSGAGADNNFSNPENWTNGVAPGVTDGCIFSTEATQPQRVHFNVVGTEAAPLMQDFYCGYSGVDYTFSSAGPMWIPISGFTSLASICRDRMTVTGSDTEMHFFPAGGQVRCLVGDDAKLRITDGAKVYVEKLGFSNKKNMVMAVSNENSLLSFDIQGTGNWVQHPTFAAYDGGKIECTAQATFSGDHNPEIIADGATVDMSPVRLGYYSSSKSYANSKSFTLTSKNGGTIKIGQVYSSSGTQTYTCDNGTITVTGGNLNTAAGTTTVKVNLSGETAVLSCDKTLTIGRGSGGSAVLTMTPTLNWGDTQDGAHIKTTGSNAFTLNKTLQYKVDVSVFTNYYGAKKLAVAAATGTGTFTYTAPTAAVNLFGKGEANCSATLAKGTSGTKGTNYNKCLYLTITSTNVPEGKVAAINNSSSFFDTLPEAVAAAPNGKTVMVFDDMAVTGNLIAAEGCAVTVDAPKPVVIKLTGKVGEGVTFGDNVTVKKTGLAIYLR